MYSFEDFTNKLDLNWETSFYYTTIEGSYPRKHSGTTQNYLSYDQRLESRQQHQDRVNEEHILILPI